MGTLENSKDPNSMKKEFLLSEMEMGCISSLVLCFRYSITYTVWTYSSLVYIKFFL